MHESPAVVARVPRIFPTACSFRQEGRSFGRSSLFSTHLAAIMEVVLRIHYRWEIRMETSRVSPKFQVVIPLRVRRALGLRPGQRVQVIPYEGRIELVPLEPIKKARGFLKGIDTTVEREPDRV